MLLKKKNKFKPSYKILIRLRENIQNKTKILNFKKQKWERFIFHLKNKIKPYRKYKLKDQNLYRVSKFPTKGLSYRKNFRNSLISSKRFTFYYGGMLKKNLKKTIKLTKNVVDFIINFEKRIDCVIYRAKFCNSMRSSRQLISHGKVLVNKQVIKNSSYKLKMGDIVSIVPKTHKIIEKNLVNHFFNSTVWPLPPKYLIINYKTMEIVFGEIQNNLNITFTNFNFNLNLEKLTQNYKYH